ncbi:hypothetical protein P389DRAFT_162158 [Cystobasidium minutum MCA 4210]|uniref:uncharacterized protein n=1 Tax=Cystobasidium minutum MCA 4210 TaxID=1397322 RepID=UPI0034CE827E|eukprot:jgi/Rhomi1/162158/estExt_Genewise1Plus.C_5_t20173
MVYLRHQYRMNADIMAISNRLVYNSTLVCGTPELATRSLAVRPPTDSWMSICAGCTGPEKGCWLEQIIEPSRHVVFVNTDAMPAREERLGRLVQNETEARLVKQTVLALSTCGVAEDQIGVITLYRQQIKLLEGMLSQYKGVEILTADKSQGRDKDCIVMSLTRSNAEKHVGDLIKDWRRLNVCFTRARFKLIIFGSRSTLDEVPHMQEFFALADERKWIYSMPKDANLVHSFTQSPTKPIRMPRSTAPPTRRHETSPGCSSNTSKITIAKRPASTAPPGYGPKTPSSPRRDGSVVIDLSLSSSPDLRPPKIRKIIGSTGKLSSPPKRMTATAKLAKDRPILRDILNSQ